MSTSGSDYHFQFEIAIVLVIGLLIYVFVSLAMVAGYQLWNIQSKVDTLKLKQHSSGSLPSNDSQNSPAAQASSADYTLQNRIEKLQNDLEGKRVELCAARSGLEDEKEKNRGYRMVVATACDTLGKLAQTGQDYNLPNNPDAALKNVVDDLRKVKAVKKDLDEAIRPK